MYIIKQKKTKQIKLEIGVMTQVRL